MKQRSQQLLIQRIWSESKKTGMRTQDRECTLFQSGQGMGLQKEIWELGEGTKRLPSAIVTSMTQENRKYHQEFGLASWKMQRKISFLFLKKYTVSLSFTELTLVQELNNNVGGRRTELK